MGIDEDYLDRLLNAVTENYREEQGITEPARDIGDRFVSNPDAVITSTPLTETAKPKPKAEPSVENGTMFAASGNEGAVLSSGDEQVSSFADIPMDMPMGDIPVDMSMGDIPADMGMGDIPVDMSMGDIPADMGMGDIPLDMSMGDIPGDIGVGDIPMDMGTEMPLTGEMPMGDISIGDLPMNAGMEMPEQADLSFEDDGPGGLDILNAIDDLTEEELNSPQPEFPVEEEPVPVAQEEPVPVAQEEPVPVAEEEPVPVAEEPAPVVEEPAPAEEEPAPAEEEPAPAEEEPAPMEGPSDDPNHVMTPEEIAALVGGAEEPAPVEEEPAPVEEEPAPVEEEPAPAEEEPAPMEGPSDDPNHIMTPEEIAALVGGAEEPAEEEEPAPVEEEPAPMEGPSDDPNHIMTPEEIAALVGGAEEPVPAEEEPAPAEEEPAPMEGPSDDPNHIMTPEEIAALVGGAEEPAPAEEEPAPAEEEPAPMEGPSDDPNHIMTPEEIAALVGGAEEPAPVEEEPAPAEEEPAPMEGPSDDPNHIMTPEEIAALVGGAEEPAPAEEEPAPMEEEPAPIEEEPAPAEEETSNDPNRTMTAEEIEAMFATAEDVAAAEDGPEAAASDGGSERNATLTLNEVDNDVIPLDFGGEEEPGTADILGDLGLIGEADADADVTDIIDGMTGDSELSEINDLLKKNDNSEMVEDELLSMLQEPGGEDEEGQRDVVGEEPEEDDEKPKKKWFGRKKKKRKSGEEAGEDAEGDTVKKKGLLARIAAFLFEGDEEADGEGGEGLQPAIAEDGTLVANPSEQTLENNEVLKEASEEDGKGKKKKKKKKEKKPKEKKEKKPKPPKPKKEKKPKEPEEPGKRLPRKKVIAVALFFASFLAAVTFCTFAFANVGYENAAKTNYEKGDYKGVYESLIGLDHISADSQEIYNKAFVLMRLQRRIDAYNEFKQREDDIDALDSLIQGVQIRDGLSEYAESLGVGSEFEGKYQEIAGILADMFGVDEDYARELYEISDEVKYTMALLDIVDPGWKDDIVPTVALTEGGQGIEFAEDGLTVNNPAHQEPPTEIPEEEPAPDAEITEVTEEPQDAGEVPQETETETPPASQGEGITLTPDSDTVIIPQGAQLQVTPKDNNVSAPPADGQTLYQFNVKKDANGNYVQQ